MQRKRNRIWLLVLPVLFLVACSTKKSAVLRSAAENDMIEILSASSAVSSPVNAVSASVRVMADIDGNALSARGTLRMKSGEGIQFGFTALGLVEVACVEFLPQSMRMIYKLGKEYAEVPYADVAFLNDAGIDYVILESVMMNRVFFPDGKSFAESAWDLSLVNDGEFIIAATPEYKGVLYRFYIEKNTGDIVRVEGVYKGRIGIECLYSGFKPLGNRRFPHKMQMQLTGTDKPVSLQFEISKAQIDNVKFSSRNIPSSYTELDVEALLKLIGNN